MNRRTILRWLGFAPAAAAIPTLAAPEGVDILVQRGAYQCGECGDSLLFDGFTVRGSKRGSITQAAYAIARCCAGDCSRQGLRVRVPLERLTCANRRARGELNMGMYDSALKKSGGSAVKPIPGGSTATGSAEDEAEKESREAGEPEEGFGKDMHAKLAEHHEAKATHHEREANEHGRMAEHHRDMAAWHNGRAG